MLSENNLSNQQPCSEVEQEATLMEQNEVSQKENMPDESPSISAQGDYVNYTSVGFESAVIYSHFMKLTGQSHRCSKNFNFDAIRKRNCIHWVCHPDVVFDVMLDKTMGIDPVVLEGVKNDSVTYFPETGGNGVYIANVRNKNGGSFTTDGIFTIDVIPVN